MKKFLAECFKGPIAKEQSKDTGMAMVLLLLLFSSVLKRHGLVTAAMVVLVVDMIYPLIFRPVAFVWLGFSHLLGTVMSRILLTIVFFLVVTPMGIARRLMRKDSMNLTSFKANEQSVMAVRNHTFVAKDLEKPY